MYPHPSLRVGPVAPPLFGNPAASEEARGFAPPPRGGFAFIAAT